MKRKTNNMYQKLTLAICAILAFSAFQSCDGDTLNKDKIDPAFTQALSEINPNIQSVKWEGREGYIVANGREGKYDVSVWFTAAVKWAMTETEYGQDVNQLPQAVTNTIEASEEYGHWSVDDIDFYERPDISFYVIELESPEGYDIYIYITPTGNILKATATDETVTPETVFSDLSV